MPNSKMRLRWLLCLIQLQVFLSKELTFFVSLGVMQQPAIVTMPQRVPRRRFLSHASGLLIIIPAKASAFGKSPPSGDQQQHRKYPVTQVDGKDWKDVLTSGQYFVLRQGGTEPPFSYPLVSQKHIGVYVCAGCVSPLFDSTQKFDSGTGWPSFARPRASAVEVVPRIGTLLGSEVKCCQCGGHLGDVYKDGFKFPNTPAELTNMRYCINGAALVFVPIDEDDDYARGPVVGDGLSNRKRILPSL